MASRSLPPQGDSSVFSPVAGGRDDASSSVRSVVDGEDNGKKGRTTNFNTWELITLCKAYANCTSDPRVGNGQKGSVFWGKVADKYEQMHGATDISISKRQTTRSADQLQNKFKVITAHMILFNKHYRQLHSEKPSGVPEEEYVDIVVDRFKELENKPFRFKECVPILHDIIKFRPFHS